jgi:hypothetical protein
MMNDVGIFFSFRSLSLPFSFITFYIIDSFLCLLCHFPNNMGTSQSQYRPNFNHLHHRYFGTTWGQPHHTTPHHHGHHHHHHIRPTFSFGAPPPHLRRRC